MAKRKRKPRKSYDIDIVIPVFGKSDLLKDCLDSIPDALDGLEPKIYLIDDNGPDRDELDKIYSGYSDYDRTIIHNQDNVGFPRSANVGINSGRAPLVLILNTDCHLEPDAIDVMATTFRQDEAIGIVGPKLLFADGRWDQPGQPNKQGAIQHAGMAFNLRRLPIHINLGWPADHPKVNRQREMQAVTGACMMFRRSTYENNLQFYKNYGDPTTGAFNEVYSPGTYEDVEFCFVARELGSKVVYAPGAVARHYVGASSAGQNVYFPLGRNASIFNARCGHAVVWDEWKYT